MPITDDVPLPEPDMEKIARCLCAWESQDPDQVLDIVNGKPTKWAWQRKENMARSIAALLSDQMRAYGDARAAAAVREERERCAQICDDMVLYTGLDCAAAIRQSQS